jgi:hypothetical protein
MPWRDWCPVCGSARVRAARVHVGTVEETTIVRKGAGPPGVTIRVGSVRLDGGGVVIARLEAGAGQGLRVRMLDDDGAVVARPR